MTPPKPVVPRMEDHLRMLFTTMPSTPVPEVPVEISWITNSSATASLAFCIDNIMHRLRQPRTKCTAPLAEVCETTMDIEELRFQAEQLGIIDDTCNEAFVWLLTDKLADAYRPPKHYKKHVSRGFDGADIEMLLKYVLTPDPSAYAHPGFKVPKADPSASRFVTDESEANDWIDWASIGGKRKVRTDDLQSIIENTLKATAAWTADGLSYFYQLPIGEKLGRLNGVAIASRRGGFTLCRARVVPMGTSWSMFVGQELSRLVCHLTKIRAKKRFPHLAKEIDEAHLFSWIDNFICTGTSFAAVDAIRQEFVRTCASVSLTLKELPKTQTETIEFLGLQFSLPTHTVRPMDSMREKLKAGLRKADRLRRDTGRGILSLFGMAGWVNYTVRRQALCMYPALMALVRRICAAQAWDVVTDIDEAARNELRSFLHAAFHAVRKPDEGSAPDLFSRLGWTDSSNDLIAGILQSSAQEALGDIEKFTLCTPHEQIYISELYAMLLGWLEWDEPANRCVMVGDNTAACSACRKGHSSTNAGDALLRAAITNAPTSSMYTAWVGTIWQRADKLTRPFDAAVKGVGPHRHIGTIRNSTWRAQPSLAASSTG